jgi:ElaB/YqjD/DUF883 family membrane-anchored ribosome-binding protein
MFGSGNRMSDVTSELDNLRTDLSRLAGAVTGLVGSQAQSTTDSVRDRWGGIGKSLSSRASDAYSRTSDWTSRGSDVASQAADQLQRANSHLEDAIERNPIASVLIAAGIGLAIGIMSRRS